MRTDTEILDWIAENVGEIATLKDETTVEISYWINGDEYSEKATGSSIKESLRMAVDKAIISLNESN